MDFEDAKRWLNALPEPTDWDLDRMRQLVADAGLDLDRLKIVQVAGTNGKGSTCAFLSAMMVHAGVKTALYTSPHLLDVRERIQIDGKMISKIRFAALGNWTKPLVEKNGASQFEALTLMAFKHFLDENVDWAVVEVGLGGRKDATSILKPKLALITHVALDHSDKLGDTEEEIAKEKAGIIAQQGFCLTTADGKAFRVIKNAAEGKNAHVKKVVPLAILRESPLTVRWNGEEVPLALQGRFQAENAALAVAAACELQNQGVPIRDEHIITGLKDAQWPGRMQAFGSVIVDGAHNPDGIRTLVDSLKTAYPGTRWNVVFGVLADKDYAGMVDEICRLPIESVALVTPKNLRALKAEKLKPLIEKKTNAAVSIAPDVASALKAMESKAVLVCGSLYVAAEALRALKE